MMPRTESPPLFFQGKPEEHVRKVSLIVRELLQGKSNNVASVTLSADATSTVIADDRYSCDTIITLTPGSVSAAAALASGAVWTESHKGEITIHHDSQPDSDRIFGAVFVG